LSKIEKNTDVPLHNHILLNKRIEIDLDEIEEPYQNIPSSPLLTRNENSFSYSSILIYMQKKFNLHTVTKLDHSVCGVKRTLENNTKENIDINVTPAPNDSSTYKKVKKGFISDAKEMDEENIKIDLSPAIKSSMHKPRPLEVRKNLNFNNEERRARLSLDLEKKPKKEFELTEEGLGHLLGYSEKENFRSLQERASRKLKITETINFEKIEAES
jgi:hypothetical protein